MFGLPEKRGGFYRFVTYGIGSVFSHHATGLCGRFTANQLDRELSTRWRLVPSRRAAAMLLAGTLSAASVRAMRPDVTPSPVVAPEMNRNPSAGPYPSPEDTVRAIVLDERHQPVVAAAVRVEGTSISTITDSTGYFVLVIPENASPATLRVDAIGYTTQIVAATSLTKGCPVQLQTAITSTLTGEVVYVGGVIVRRTWWQRLFRRNGQ